MNDRELLELAAKAASQERSIAGDLWSPARGCLWDPLNDDGDALRLAVKLRLLVDVDVRITVVAPRIADVYAACGDDCFAATRLAIVRAAAEIGRKKGEGK